MDERIGSRRSPNVEIEPFRTVRVRGIGARQVVAVADDRDQIARVRSCGRRRPRSRRARRTRGALDRRIRGSTRKRGPAHAAKARRSRIGGCDDRPRRHARRCVGPELRGPGGSVRELVHRSPGQSWAIIGNARDRVPREAEHANFDPRSRCDRHVRGKRQRCSCARRSRSGTNTRLVSSPCHLGPSPRHGQPVIPADRPLLRIHNSARVHVRGHNRRPLADDAGEQK